MRALIYPDAVSAWGMDLFHIEAWGDWKNTYENYPLLMGILESDGIGIINQMWRASYSHEYPLQSYKRLQGLNQQEMNDRMFGYARWMASFDFPYNHLGVHFRKYREQDLKYSLPSVQSTWTILRQDPVLFNRFQSPIELAPEEFGYNIIPIYPNPDSCAVPNFLHKQ